MKKNIKISVCIPVYNTEPFLLRCLDSLTNQNFDNFEIVIINDCSSGKNEEGLNCCKIVKKFKKSTKIPITYYENSENRGTLETRRTAVYESNGEYIFFLDSDDFLEKNILSTLYETAVSKNADIVQGQLIAGKIIDNEFITNKVQKLNNIFTGELSNHEIFKKSFLEQKISINLCSKLIKKELLIYAFSQIPYTFCNYAEDFLIYFFITLKSNSYCGLSLPTYKYITSTGITANKKINSLEECEKIASCSAIFTNLQLWIQDNPDILEKEEILSLKMFSTKYLKNIIQHFETNLSKELLPKAYKLLNEYWGENLVNNLKNSLS